jgi:Raf kinase inhibitor-like YbhB/YbcL family protein
MNARILAGIGMFFTATAAFAQQAAKPPAPQPQLVLSSPAFGDGATINRPYACENSKNFSKYSPAFAWTGVPEGTASFALIFHDADAHPRKSADDVLHWMIWNIPGTATKLGENQPPTPEQADGTRQSKNVTGQVGYLGPCAPAGKPHHYIFELYALDKKLDVGPDGTRADVVKAMDGHVLASSVLVGHFNQ